MKKKVTKEMRDKWYTHTAAPIRVISLMTARKTRQDSAIT